MDYKGEFDPTRPFAPAAVGDGLADRRDGAVYVYNDPRIALAINVALVTGRPLLLSGRSGTGKSSLARNVAIRLGFRYYEAVVTSRTQARDFLWEVDLLHRLHDAQLRKSSFSRDITPYIKPAVLWWAFDRDSAARRGDLNGVGPFLDDPALETGGDRAVVLIDEIDKAEPDVPNNLLVPLGSLRFQVEETSTEVKIARKNAPLLIITTNGERELPTAFLRRCIQLELNVPEVSDLLDIAQAHFSAQCREALETIAKQLHAARDAMGRKEPLGPAEFLDTVRACTEMNVVPGSEAWNALVRMTFLKP